MKDYWNDLIVKYQRGSMTMKRFSDQQGIDYRAFYYRKKVYDEQNSRKIKQGALLPVNICLTRDESPVETIKSKSEQPYLEIQYPNGVKVVLYAEIPSKKLLFLIHNALC